MIAFCRFALALMLFGLFPRSAAPEVSYEDVLKSVLKSVFAVTADNCVGQSRQSTAFVWKSDGNVITAWHAIGGCNAIRVRSQVTGQSWQAHVSKVLPSADLALLSLTDAPSFPALQDSDETLHVGQELHTLGYQMGADSAGDRDIHLRFGGPKLRNLVDNNSEAFREIQQSGTPNLDIDILYIDSLVPGLSGAPIFDSSGNVVGVADGGLEGGRRRNRLGVAPKIFSVTSAVDR
jgi:S1-C subfamily serine protease